MRFIFPILFFTFLFPLSIRADMLRGKVISIDREKGEIVMQARNCSQCRFDPVSQDDGKTDPSLPMQESKVVIHSDPIPLFAKPQAFIRVWGRFMQDKENHFLARRIAGPGWREHGRDFTGVRSRLRKGCFMERKHHGPPAGQKPLMVPEKDPASSVGGQQTD